MANKTFKDMTLRIDNASGTLADITAFINQQSLEHAMSILEDTGMGLEERTTLPGLAGTTVEINGFVNTTTDAIFGPAFVSDNTSLAKTVAFKESSARFYKGEFWASNYTISGSRDTLETFSLSLTATGAITRTSIVGT